MKQTLEWSGNRMEQRHWNGVETEWNRDTGMEWKHNGTETLGWSGNRMEQRHWNGVETEWNRDTGMEWKQNGTEVLDINRTGTLEWIHQKGTNTLKWNGDTG